MIEECRGCDYEKRLKIVGLTTLETRRVRADLIEVYKILHGQDKVNEELFFERVVKTDEGGFSGNVTRGHSLKLFKRRFRLDVAKYSFGNRVVDNWNHLPGDIVHAESLNAFKGRLDKFLGHTGGLV